MNAVTETGTADDVTWARQAIDALLELKKAADESRAAGRPAISAEVLSEHSGWFRQAAAAGTALNAARRTALQKKRHVLAARTAAREADYLRFASDLRVPFDNNEAERVIRSYLATAARHEISWLDALTLAAQGKPWIPLTG